MDLLAAIGVAQGGDGYHALHEQALGLAMQLWRTRRITNFDYLMALNALAGRSPNDLTQYPVFPWVLQDYDSASLDLARPTAFRDLSKPMGALFCAQAVQKRYEDLSDILESEHDEGHSRSLLRLPYHYGTHYSSPGIVLHYLIRLQPFAAAHIALQNGRFDAPERLFRSVKGAWLSASG
jgi:hypothetical protein